MDWNDAIWALTILVVVYLNACCVWLFSNLGNKHRKPDWQDKFFGPGVKICLTVGLKILAVCEWLRTPFVKSNNVEISVMENVVLGQVDTPNPMGITYPKHIVMMGFMNKGPGPILGGINDTACAGDGTAVDLAKVSHTVEAIRIDDQGFIRGTIRVLNTPQGELLKQLMKQRDGGIRGYGIRSYVEAEPDRNGPGKVVTKMQIITIDAVAVGQ